MEFVSSDFTIDIRRLRVLQEVRDRGTIAAAAAALHLTSSAVSQQIAKLSRETGAPLLSRQGRRVRLTEQAHVLLEHAAVIYRQMERARADLAAHGEGYVGRVSLGAFGSAVTGLVAPMLGTLGRQRPRIAVTVHETEAPDCFTRLDGGALDIVITIDYRNGPTCTDPRYHRIDLLFDPLILALPDDHPLATCAVLDLKDLSASVWVVGADKGPCAEINFAACAMAGFTPDTRHRVNEWTAALALVAAGTGIALVPRLAIAAPPAGVVFRPLAPPGAGRTIYVAVRAGSQDNPTLATVLDALRRQADSYTSSAPVALPDDLGNRDGDGIAGAVPHRDQQCLRAGQRPL